MSQPDENRALAWRIDCNNRLTVTIAVAGKYVFLLSQDGHDEEKVAPWRIGSYMDANEAQRRAIEMTGSYERLRQGKVGPYAELTLPNNWEPTENQLTVDNLVGTAIALALSPTVSPVTD